MRIIKLDVRITLTEPLLGSASGNPEIHHDYIAAKAEDPDKAKEEIEAIDVNESLEKSTTVFSRDNKGQLHLWDYQVRGFFKEALKWRISMGELELTAYKKFVDNSLFVNPRRLVLHGEDGQPLTKPNGILQRPLRAQTAQGERIALAASEQCLEGTYFDAEIQIMLPEKDNGDKKLRKLSGDDFTAALDYGKLKGLGQWRNSGCGRFNWELREG